jgi:hypothetical protein
MEQLSTGDIYFLLFVLACLYLSMTISPKEEKKLRRKTMALRRYSDPNEINTEDDSEGFVSQRPSMN